ncbi:MAG TPA: hypothetical protein VJU53_08275 [Burkholderiaceae bacterium]|nr:hypothetical protein [Burkholderiaceae bacterium]
MSSFSSSASSPAPSGNALDEYKHLGEDLRHYSILRLARLTLLLGTTGAVITALASDTVRAHSVLFALLKMGGLVIALVFAVMDYRSGAHWLRLQRRSNVLAQTLGFESRSIANAWNPLATTGASRALHLFLVFGWIFALLLPLFRR